MVSSENDIESERGGGKRLGWTLLGWLALYFALHVAIRVSASGTVDIDEGEQLVMTQWLQAGYGPQPPLYTWLQMGVFGVIGRSVFALSVLKNALLLLSYAFVFGAGHVLTGDRRRAALGAMGLLLLPEVAWAAQRDLTHSVLAMCMSAAIFWLLLLVIRNRAWWQYALLGAAIGLGLLSKYNVLFSTAALLVGGLCTRQGRAAIVRPQMLLSLLIAAAIVWPHASWLLDHSDVLRTAADRAGVSRSPSVLKSLGSLAWACVQAVGPLLAVSLACFGWPVYRRRSSLAVDYSGLAFVIGVCACMVAIVVVTDLPHVKVRWLQPALVIVPVLLAAHLDPARLTASRIGALRLICVVVAVVVLVIMGIRTRAARVDAQFDQHVFDFDQIAAELRSRLGGEPTIIVSDFALIAGNLKHQFPDVLTYLPGVHDSDLVEQAQSRGAVIVWEQNARRRVPETLMALIEQIVPRRRNRGPVQVIQPHSAAGDPLPAVEIILLEPSAATRPSSR